MSELPIFDGKGNVHSWITRMEKFFVHEGIREEAVMERLDCVQPFLSDDVKACMQVLSGHLQARLEPGMLWIWKWPSFSYALRKIEAEIATTRAKAIEDTKSRRKEKYLMIGAAIVASPLILTIFSPVEAVAVALISGASYALGATFGFKLINGREKPKMSDWSLGREFIPSSALVDSILEYERLEPEEDMYTD